LIGTFWCLYSLFFSGCQGGIKKLGKEIKGSGREVKVVGGKMEERKWGELDWGNLKGK